MADGRITIDTGLDTSGFDKGSESMKRALESMLSSANSAGKAMQGGFTGVAEKIQTAAKASQEMGDTAGRFTFAQYIAQAQSDMASLMNTMSKMGKETDKLGTEKGIQQFDASMQNARDAIMALYQRIVQLNGTKVETADYEELRRGADAAAAEVERLQNKQDDLRARGVSTHSKQWLELEEQIKWAKLALDDYVGELRDGATDGSKMFELGKDSEFAPKLKELAEMYHALAETFQQFNEQLKDADVNMSQQKAATQQAEAEAAKQAEEEAAAEEAAAQAEERHAAVAAALGNVMSALGTILSTVAKAALKELKDELKHLARQLQTLGQWYVRAPFEALEKGAQLATSALGMVKTGAEKTVSALGSVADSVKKAASGFGGLLKKLSLFSKQGGGVGDVATDMVKKLTSLKRMLITRVKRMFISSVFKDMTSAIQAIANKSKTFNAAMSSMQNATKGLTANLAVSFSNLIALVAPIITQIINWITTLITYLNGFFAMLSGAKSIMTAKKATDAYGKSAGGASKKAQELKKQVMGFDEINNLTEQDDSGGGGGAGAGAADFEQKMIDELLPDKLRAYFEKIKKAIADENWEEVGGLAADGLNECIDKIDEVILNFRKKGVKWSIITAKVMNGFVKRFSFKKLGKTIADGLNDILAIENNFLETFDFFVLGAKLGEGVNAMFEEIEWEEVGKNFGMKIMAINDTLNGFLKEFKASAAGADLGTAAGAMFDEIQWTGEGGIADTFSTGINSITEAVNGFITEFEKDGPRRRDEIQKAIKESIIGIRWDEVIATLGLGFKLIGLWVSSAFVGLTEGIKEKTPEVVQAINGLITDDSFSETAGNVGDGVQNLIDAFDKLTDPKDGIDFKGLGDKIGEGINIIVEKIDFGQALVAVVHGFAGLATMFSGAFSLINFSKIAEDMVKGINSLVAENAFSQVWENVTTGLNNIIDAFNELVGGEGSKTGGIDFDGIADNIAENLNGLIKDTHFDTAVDAVLTGIGRIFQAFSHFMSTIEWNVVAEKFKAGIEKFVKSKKIDWRQIGHDLGTAFNNAVAAIADFLEDVPWDEIKDKISTALSAIPWGDIASNLFRIFKQQMKIKFNLVEAVAAGLMGRTDNWQLGGYGQLGDKLRNMAEDISGQFSEASDQTFYEGSKGLYDSFDKGIQDGVEPTTEQLRQAVGLLLSGFAGEMYEGHAEIANAANALLYNITQSKTLDELVQSMGAAGMEISHEFAAQLGEGSYEDVRAAIALMAQGVEQSAIEELGFTGLDAVLQNYMQTSGKSLNEVATALANDAGGAIGEIIPTAVAAGLREAQPVLEDAGQQASNIATQVGNKEQIETDSKATSESAVKGYLDGFKENETQASESAAGFVDVLETPFDQLPEDQKANAEAMFEALRLAMDSGTPEAEKATKAAADAIVEQIKGTLSAKAGSDIGSTFTGGIVSSIKSGIIGVYNQMIPVGTAIAMGIAKGIRNSQSAVTVAARNAAINAYNAAMRAIDAHSPSKLFANVGKFSMLGWAKGEEDNADAVLGTITDTTSAMEKEAEDTNLNVIDNRMLNGIDLAVDKMEEIASVFSRVADMISGIGELPVPALAEGTVIPYKTKVDMAEVDFSGLEATQPQSMPTPDSFYDVLYRAITDARNDAENDRPIELYLDGTKVMDWIERKGRQNDRARGK